MNKKKLIDITERIVKAVIKILYKTVCKKRVTKERSKKV